jgi:hypothetical protein
MSRFCIHLSVLASLLVVGCSQTDENPSGEDPDMQAANAFIDAFYSFDRDSLASILTQADATSESILFYQGWAEGGNYEIRKRHNCFNSGDSVITCPVTVKDDLIQALELDMYVTDTFHLRIADGEILAIQTSSNDPPLFYEARQWVRQNRAELTDVPCSEESNSPGDCVRAVVQGFKEFTAAR